MVERRQKFANFVLLNNLDIVCISESWLIEKMDDSELYLNDYDIYRSDRKTDTNNTRHGGTLICVKKFLKSEKFCLPFNSNGSIVACKFKLNGRSILIFSCYVPDYTYSDYAFTESEFTELTNVITAARKQVDDIIVYGDFNFTKINWNLHSTEGSMEQILLDFLDQNSFEQKINFPTAATGILDLLFVSKNIEFIKLEPISNNGEFCKMSNHIPISAIIKTKVETWYRGRHINDKIFSFCRGNYDDLNDKLIENPFSTYCWSNPEHILEKWYEWLYDLLRQTVPIRTLHRAKLPPWVSQKSSHLLKCLKTAQKRYPTSHQKVLELKLVIEDSMEQDKIHYEENLASGRSTAKLFKHFRAFRKSDLPSTLFYGTNSAHDDESKANLFAKFFGSVYIKSSDFCETLPTPATNILSDISIQEDEVAEICRNLELNKSKGPDNLPPVLYRSTCGNIAHSLCQIYRKIFQTSKFPNSWKKAIVCPIFKKGNKCNVENYRPVSLLSIASKVFEKIIFRELYIHFAPILHASQNGFRKKKSIILQLLTFLDKIYKGIDDDKEIDVVFTDFSKAFDSVDHGILLRKLYSYGVCGKVLDLLKSYLMGRSQVVKINNATSNPVMVTSGVPQGSILGPLLFLIFINDLPEMCRNLWPLLFADDAKFVNIGLPQRVAQTDLNDVIEWSIVNKLPFNLTKCLHMAIMKSSATLHFDNLILPKTSTHSDLGLTLSDDLRWNQHIEKVSGKAMRVFHMIRRNTSKLGWKAKLDLYKSMIVPIITYVSPLFGLSKYTISQIEKVQKRISYWIAPHIPSYKERLYFLNILPLPMFIQLSNLLLLSKLLNGKYEVESLQVPSYSILHRKIVFQIKRPKKKTAEDNFFYHTCRLANVVNVDLRETDGLKKKLLRIFWTNFNSFDERNNCTWRLACDCTLKNCRDIWTIEHETAGAN